MWVIECQQWQMKESIFQIAGSANTTVLRTTRAKSSRTTSWRENKPCYTHFIYVTRKLWWWTDHHLCNTPVLGVSFLLFFFSTVINYDVVPPLDCWLLSWCCCCCCCYNYWIMTQKCVDGNSNLKKPLRIRKMLELYSLLYISNWFSFKI